MKYIILITFIVLSYSTFSFHPIDEIPIEYRNLSPIRFYSTGTIIIKNRNYFSLEGVGIRNETDEDIYVFWNNFVINNLLDENNKGIHKKQIISNEVLLYDTTFEESQLNIKYSDSTISNYPVFIKFPSESKKKNNPKLDGYSISFGIKNIKKYIDYNKRLIYRSRITLNYLKSSDINKINEALGIDIDKYTITTSNTKISSHLILEGAYGYLECFKSEELKIDPKKIETVLNKYIKQVETEVYLLVLDKDPCN